MGRPNTAVGVSSAEREQLDSIARSRSLPHSLVRRARIVLMSADGISNAIIAERCGVSVPTISHWRRCWRERGVGGLHGELRPGRPRSYDVELTRFRRRCWGESKEENSHATNPSTVSC
jgi:putative transposase